MEHSENPPFSTKPFRFPEFSHSNIRLVFPDYHTHACSKFQLWPHDFLQLSAFSEVMLVKVQNLLLTNTSYEQKQYAKKSIYGSSVTPGRSLRSYSRRTQEHQWLAWGYKTGVGFIAWKSICVWLRVPKSKRRQRQNSILSLQHFTQSCEHPHGFKWRRRERVSHNGMPLLCLPRTLFPCTGEPRLPSASQE